MEKPETYKQAMNGPHAQQWAYAIQKKLDQLEKNEIWTLLAENNIEWGYKPLFDKWVFKVKKDINGAITRFKVQWVI